MLVDVQGSDYCSHCTGHMAISPRAQTFSCPCVCRGVVKLLLPAIVSGSSSMSLRTSEDNHRGVPSFQAYEKDPRTRRIPCLAGVTGDWGHLEAWEGDPYCNLSDFTHTQARRIELNEAKRQRDLKSDLSESEPIPKGNVTFMNRTTFPGGGWSLYGFPTAGTEWEDMYTEKCGGDLYREADQYNNWIGIGIGIYLIFWTILFGCGLKRYLRTCGEGDDSKMFPSGRGGRGEGGGGGRRQRTGGDPMDDLASSMGDIDLRTAEQKERDRLRRLMTQCVWVGWFDKRDEDEPATNAAQGGKKVYRRCAEHFGKDTKPYCWRHDGKPNDKGPGPEHDPSVPKDKDGKPKKRNTRGLGSMNDMIMAMMKGGENK